MLRDIENLRGPTHDNICYSVFHLMVLYFRMDSSDVVEDLLKGLNGKINVYQTFMKIGQEV